LRDHAAVMEPALRELGASIDTAWWEREPSWSWRQTRCSAARFLSELRARLTESNYDAVVWHYAVFDYGARTAWDLRGMPIHAPRVARALAGGGPPLIVVVHESAYPWSRAGGWQRNVLAAGHRAALLTVVRAADATVLTSRPRERWLISRRWLPPRPRACIPVCATLPTVAATQTSGDGRIGVLGFGTDDARPDVVVGAARELRARGHAVNLRLLGAPGAGGDRSARWSEIARALGCEAALSFTGVVAAPELARELAAVDIVVFPQAAGAGANKGTLGAALALARPVVALDGRDTWQEAVREGALIVSAPTPLALAGRLEPLIGDERARARQAAAGHAFYAREMVPAVCARRQLHFFAAVAQSR
jgi:hypothetical protein